MANPFDERMKNRVGSLQQAIDQAAIAVSRDPKTVRLMAVTKTVEPEKINAAIHSGVTLLGENRVQEFLQKWEQYDLDGVEVHFIGQLQTNKVKYIIDKVQMIQSVSSVKLAAEIDKQAKKHHLCMDVLLQVNIGNEDSKAGFRKEEVMEVCDHLLKFDNIRLRGLMCIPPKGDTKRYFQEIQQLFIDIKEKNRHNRSMDILSMGMSSDYATAIGYGSTIVRVGTGLFGERL